MKQLINLIRSIGGTPFLVGGAVIDRLRGREVKDWDIEVHGVSLDQIEKALLSMGFSCDMVGKSFGVIKTTVDGLDIDLSVPRRENRVGIGHRGFEVTFDPTMILEDAVRRRDLTINSICINMVTNIVKDPFNGLKDLKDGVLRATDPKTFIEDPLRVLRIMQLLPRKGKVVAPDTIDLCRSIVDEFDTLPKERVFDEFCKLLLKADKPSVGLQFLRDCGWIKHFPELEALIGCKQPPQFHPEGDVWNHTVRALDHAATCRDDVDPKWRLALMFGMLLHDVGKPSTTAEDLTSFGHEGAGVPIAEAFMRRLNNDSNLITKVTTIVGCHMRVRDLVKNGGKSSAWKRLHNKLRLDIGGIVSACDSQSRSDDPFDILTDPNAQEAFEWFFVLGPGVIAPILKGRHLIEKGLKPGKEFSTILKIAYNLQIDQGITDIDDLFFRSSAASNSLN